MPKGIPVATMGFGKSGFLNSCILASQILALKSDKLSKNIKNFKNQLEEKVISDDGSFKETFTA